MTVQMPDLCQYQGTEYKVVAFNGTGLVRAQDYGINPYFIHTACHRGYTIKYACKANQLILSAISVNADNPPNINGVVPLPGEDEEDLPLNYRNLNLNTNFAGTLLIAKNFPGLWLIDKFFSEDSSFLIITSFPSLSDYFLKNDVQILKLQVENGDITSITELSIDDLKAIRHDIRWLSYLERDLFWT